MSAALDVEQGDLFTPPAPAPVRPTVITLRPYQVEAVERIRAELETNRSTLLVMATGTGKTATFTEVIREWPGRCLVLAHRDELVQQAVSRIRASTGKIVGIEKAEDYAGAAAEVVVASVQTLYQPRRLERFGPNGFGLVVADEAHHYVAPSFKKVLDYFTGAKVLGVTATPDRADRLAMGAVFDSVAFVYEIEDGINDGFLCPIKATSVLVEDMQLADVRTVAGDLNQGDLDAVMSTERVLHGVAKPTIELAGGRRTLVFTTSVANAHRLAEVFNRYKADSARAVDGGMDLDLRRRTLADHQAGKFQFLCNVAVLTEGYDDPLVACVAMGRPTKSRALYTQMVGRGTRVAPGKADLLVLDFCGNAGKHALVSATDILAGRFPDEVVERARRKVANEPGTNVREALLDAEAEIKAERERAARRAAARARVAYRTTTVDPFKVLMVEDPANRWGGQFGSAPASEKQLNFLTKAKVALPEGITKSQANSLISEVIRRRNAGLCSFGQAKILQRYGYPSKALTFVQASRLIDALARNGWRRLDQGDSDHLMERVTGEEG